MENLFEIGDTVRLFSGGPLMTVNFYDAATGAVECIWFNALDDKAESTFKAEVLMHDVDSEFDFEDLEFTKEGVKIFIKRSKTDQSGEGRIKAIPYFKEKSFNADTLFPY